MCQMEQNAIGSTGRFLRGSGIIENEGAHHEAQRVFRSLSDSN